MGEQKRYVVTGIGTDVGKTVVSAIIAQALEAARVRAQALGDEFGN